MEDAPSGSFLDRAYQLLMTPLPLGMLPSLDVEGLMAALREHGKRVSGAMPSLPAQLPQMPAPWMEYARERGLVPPSLPGGMP